MGAPFLSSALLVSHASKNHATLKYADSKLIDSRLTRECSKEAAHLKEGPSKLQVEQHCTERLLLQTRLDYGKSVHIIAIRLLFFCRSDLSPHSAKGPVPLLSSSR